MKNFELSFIQNVTQAKVLNVSATIFTQIGTDTRQDLTGKLFIALKGENFDAHQFLNQAVEKGAAGILVHDTSSLSENFKKQVTIIQVDDTLKALQSLGQAVRRKMPAKVLSIMGSNGKTSTKEFSAAILSHSFNVHWSQGSFNNHWGVPFTLLDIEPQHQVAVVEIGMNRAGEIADLVKLAEPDAVLCTTVGRAHIEFFGTQEKIAEVKEETYIAAAPTTTRIYNLDNSFTLAMYERGKKQYPQAKLLTFSNQNKNADAYLQIEEMNLDFMKVKGQIQGVSGYAQISVFGAQNIINLAAASALAIAGGMKPTDIWEGIKKCKSAWGRNQRINLKSGADLIFDAYNANPDSMQALFNNVTLTKVSGKKIAVLGQMLELGELSAQLHEEVGASAGKSGFDAIYFIGKDKEAFAQGLKKSGYNQIFVTADNYSPEMGQDLEKQISKGSLVIMKASRGTKLERFLPHCNPIDTASHEH